MNCTSLISVAELAARVDDRDILVVDCRFDLSNPAQGARDYAGGHIPHAVYAHLDDDLSDHSVTGMGRHPFPADAAFSSLLARWGVQKSTQIICHDAGNGSMAARLWWMLQAVGHRNAAVLDGGLAAWIGAGLPLQTEVDTRAASDVSVRFDGRHFATFEDIERDLVNQDLLLIDARGAPRFRGEIEPIDVVAGHVPGAINRPFTDNLGADECFKSVDVLRAEFDALLAGKSPAHVVMMCGSGVTACHNLLAMHRAGLEGARLFAPSWSGWISDQQRPIAVG